MTCVRGDKKYNGCVGEPGRHAPTLFHAHLSNADLELEWLATIIRGVELLLEIKLALRLTLRITGAWSKCASRFKDFFCFRPCHWSKCPCNALSTRLPARNSGKKSAPGWSNRAQIGCTHAGVMHLHGAHTRTHTHMLYKSQPVIYLGGVVFAVAGPRCGHLDPHDWPAPTQTHLPADRSRRGCAGVEPLHTVHLQELGADRGPRGGATLCWSGQSSTGPRRGRCKAARQEVQITGRVRGRSPAMPTRPA